MNFKALLLIVTYALMSPITAIAHTTIASSNIQNDSKIVSAPDIFEVTFGDEVGFAGVNLSTVSGKTIAIEFERPKTLGRDFSVILPTLPPDSYVLEWRAISKDGHVMRGELNFTVTG